jgi:predicted aspartyl protease
MNFPFDPSTGAIIVSADLAGPTGQTRLRLLLDTGANTTVIAEAPMVAVGFDPSAPPGQVPVTTASAVGSAGLFIVPALAALGVVRSNFPILCYSLPPGVDLDGLLGFDFFEGHVLTLDFVNHTLSLT